MAMVPHTFTGVDMGNKQTQTEVVVVKKVKANPSKPNLSKKERSTLALMLARQILADRKAN